jgi:hypothetical protein
VQWGAVFVDFFHILLLFVTFFTARNFYKLFFTAETGVRFVTFFTFFTVCNFHKLLFTVEKGQGLYFIHCARGERVHLDFAPETKPHLVRICSSKIIKLSDRRNWLLAHCPIANIPQNLKVGQLCCYSLCFNDYLHSDRTTIVYVSGCPNPFPLPVTSFSNMENILDSFSLQPC